jgi:ABC-type phosphate transport system substrate-binding protein
MAICGISCSWVLKQDSAQCHEDSDCASFGSHPYCRGGVCVPSGLGPPACIYIAADQTPHSQSDFQNQCSDCYCVAVENCKALGICGDADPPLVAPPDAQAVITSSVGADAGAIPLCADPGAGRDPRNLVYISGASTWPAIIAQLAPVVIAAGGPTPVFLTTSSCTAVQAIFDGVPMKDPAPGSAVSKYATYYTADGGAFPCLLGDGGASVDIGASDVFSTSCGYPAAAAANSANDTTGAIQAVTFLAPVNSSATAISAEGAHEVFGAGDNDAAIPPWTNPKYYFVRNAGTGSQQMVSRAIGVPATAFWGSDQGTATNLVKNMSLLTQEEANLAIGFVSVSSYDPNRATLKALAFQAKGQDCAYLPDSNPQSTDKRNVRDGHYPIWGPIHFLTSFPASSAAQAFLTPIAVPGVPSKVLDAYIAAYLVPTCAMTVERDTELGPLKAYVPPPKTACGCYFESKQSALSSDCVVCDDAHPCPASRPACNYGYCELQ